MGVFGLLVLFYIFVGIQTLVRVIRRWPHLFGDQLTHPDSALVSKAAFFLLIPPTVALHELGHSIAIWAYGLRVVDFGFYGYMGYVVPSGSAGPLGDFWISLAGNLVTFLIGLVCLFVGLRYPGRPYRNILAIELGRQSMFIVLVFYPLICLAFPGDWQRIYDFSKTPIASGAVAVAHALVIVFGYFGLWRNRWRARSLLLSSRYATMIVEAEHRLKSNPSDLEAMRMLGIVHSDAGAPRVAREYLEPVVRAGKADGQTYLAYGLALLELGANEEATEALQSAEGRLLRPELRELATGALIRALEGAGRSEEAVALADKVSKEALDLGSLEAWAKAMRRLNRQDELRAQLEGLDGKATDPERKRLLRQLIDQTRV